MEDERRMSMRTRKLAPKMAAALASAENRTQVFIFLIIFFHISRLVFY